MSCFLHGPPWTYIEPLWLLTFEPTSLLFHCWIPWHNLFDCISLMTMLEYLKELKENINPALSCYCSHVDVHHHRQLWWLQVSYFLISLSQWFAGLLWQMIMPLHNNRPNLILDCCFLNISVLLIHFAVCLVCHVCHHCAHIESSWLFPFVKKLSPLPFITTLLFHVTNTNATVLQQLAAWFFCFCIPCWWQFAAWCDCCWNHPHRKSWLIVACF